MSWADLFWQSADGLRLHARDYAAADGEARLPVFCLHGLTRNARDFGAFAPLVASWGRRVLAIDVRGRGASGYDPNSRYLIPTYAADVTALAEALGIARAVFVGTSMGGLITMEVAALAPDLIVAAIVNDVGPELDPRGLARIAGYVGHAPQFSGWQEASEYLADQNSAALPHYGDAEWRRMAERMFRDDEGRIVADYDPAIATPFIGEAPQIDPWDRWDNLAEDRPLLLLRGERSDLLSPQVADRMAIGRANVSFREIPGVGHAPMLDEDASIAAIESFLALCR